MSLLKCHKHYAKLLSSNMGKQITTVASCSTSNQPKRVLITGGNRGIGFSTSCLLASKGYEVTLTSRNLIHGQKAAEEIIRINPHAKVNVIQMDLTSTESVRESAAELNRKKEFDVLIMNAGVMLPSDRMTKDGLETTFQVNYLSHFLLAFLLLHNQKSLKRIVPLTSVNAKWVGFAPKIEADGKRWLEWFNNPTHSPMASYGLSKFALSLLALNLNKVEGIDAVAVHPGVVPTGISDRWDGKWREILKNFGASYFYVSQETAAERVEMAVTSSYKHGYFQDAHKVSKFSPFIRSHSNQANLDIMNKQILHRYLNISMEPQVSQI